VQAVDAGDVRVVQGCEQPGFPGEASPSVTAGCEGFGKNLDGNAAVQGRVVCPPDHAHSTLADLLVDAVVQQRLAGRGRRTLTIAPEFLDPVAQSAGVGFEIRPCEQPLDLGAQRLLSAAGPVEEGGAQV
jgi:hypothetical protein